MKGRTYHGWIIRERIIREKEGSRDKFYVSFKVGEETIINFAGYGAYGATHAVEFFEVEKQLGRITLEETPLGLRVFTEEKTSDA